MTSEFGHEPEEEITIGDQYHNLWELLKTAIKSVQLEQIKGGSDVEDVKISIDFDPDAYFLEGRIVYGLYCLTENKPIPEDCAIEILKKEVDEYIDENKIYFEESK